MDSLTNVDLMTTEELLDIVVARQESCGCLYFMSYEDDEDTDSVYFYTNMKEGDIEEMMEVFETWKEDNDEEATDADD